MFLYAHNFIFPLPGGFCHVFVNNAHAIVGQLSQ